MTEDNVRELSLDELAFERLGMLAPDDEVQAFSYDVEDADETGKEWGGTGNGCGGHAGLHLTVQQLATFLTTMARRVQRRAWTPSRSTRV